MKCGGVRFDLCKWKFIEIWSLDRMSVMHIRYLFILYSYSILLLTLRVLRVILSQYTSTNTLNVFS